MYTVSINEFSHKDCYFGRLTFLTINVVKKNTKNTIKRILAVVVAAEAILENPNI
jgi:hypothetical protein